MTNCKGILGYFFGHKFEKATIEFKEDTIKCSSNIPLNEIHEIYFRRGENFYKRCKRCGLMQRVD